jgi:hypothetical protein
MKSLKRERKMAAQQKIKKIMILLSLSATLTLGTGVTYASDTTLGTKIHDFMTSIVNGLIPNIEAHMEKETTRIKGEISTTTLEELTKAKTGLESYASIQKNRITEELNTYKELKVQEVKSTLGDNRYKKDIEEKASSAINNGKAEIDAEVEKILNNQ